MILETEYKRNKRQRDAAIARDWKKLSANPKNSPILIRVHLAKKYGLHDQSSVFRVLQQQGAITRPYYGDDDGRAE